jgi:hypothetical protein
VRAQRACTYPNTPRGHPESGRPPRIRISQTPPPPARPQKERPQNSRDSRLPRAWTRPPVSPSCVACPVRSTRRKPETPDPRPRANRTTVDRVLDGARAGSANDARGPLRRRGSAAGERARARAQHKRVPSAEPRDGSTKEGSTPTDSRMRSALGCSALGVCTPAMTPAAARRQPRANVCQYLRRATRVERQAQITDRGVRPTAEHRGQSESCRAAAAAAAAHAEALLAGCGR